MDTNFPINISLEEDEISFKNYSQNIHLSLEDEEKKEKDPFNISMSDFSLIETSPSQIKKGLNLDESIEMEKEVDIAKNNKLFRTDKKGENDRLVMNRISARKSRLKKKKYIKQLEEESAQLKNNIILNNMDNNTNIQNENINPENKLFLNKINLLEKQEKEVKNEGQKKKGDLMKQYEILQKTILKEMLIKQIHFFLPLKYQIYGEKFIKLIHIDNNDSINEIKKKINENYSKIEKYLKIVSKPRINLVIKFFDIYKKIKNYFENFNDLLTTSFEI